MVSASLCESRDQVGESCFTLDLQQKWREPLCLHEFEDIEHITHPNEERIRTGGRLVQRHAEREKVATVVNVTLDVTVLLRRSISRRELPEHVFGRSKRLQLEMSGKAEIDEPEVAPISKDDVSRVHVAVDDLLSLRDGQNFQNLLAEPKNFGDS